MHDLDLALANTLSADLLAGNRFYYNISDYRDQLRQSFTAGKVPGETSHLKWLDEMFTMRPGFLYAFTGWPGSGKSEFITQLTALQVMFKKRRIAVYSPESYPVDEFIDTILHCWMGKSTDRRFQNVCTDQEYNQAMDMLEDHYYFCDWKETPDANETLKAFEYLRKEKKVEIFIVDPFNSLVTEGEEKNIAIGLKKNLTAFKRFAAQNKVMVWLVEHPKTPNDTKEFDMVPGPRHLFGGTMWWNKVDVLATVHRPNREDKNDTTVVLKTWKIKKQELNGRPGEAFMYFDIRTKRYYESNTFLSHPMKPEPLMDMPAHRLPYREDETPF